VVSELKGAVSTRQGEIDQLKTLIEQLQRMQFGKRSERLDPDQLALALEDLGADIGHVEESAPLPARGVSARANCSWHTIATRVLGLFETMTGKPPRFLLRADPSTAIFPVGNILILFPVGNKPILYPSGYILELYPAGNTMKPDLVRTASELGAALRRRRRALKLSQGELAERAGTTQKTVSFAESGESGTKLKTLIDLMTVLELELLVQPRAKARSTAIEEIF